MWPGLVLLGAAGAGLDTDLGEVERVRNQPRFDADVLDAVKGNVAVLAREDAALDRDLVGADQKAKARPGQPGKDQRDEQEKAERRHDIDPLARTADRGERGQEIDRARPEPDDREQQIGRASSRERECQYV